MRRSREPMRSSANIGRERRGSEPRSKSAKLISQSVAAS